MHRIFYVFCQDFNVGYIDVQFNCVGVDVSFIQVIMLNFSLYCTVFFSTFGASNTLCFVIVPFRVSSSFVLYIEFFL